MGIRIVDLPDGHFAKTRQAVVADAIARERGFELQIDTGYEADPFGNGSAYVLFGLENEDGMREQLGEYSDPTKIFPLN